MAAALCLCLSCGIYQAHISFGMVLALCHLLHVLLEDRCDVKTCWRWAFGQLGLYVVAIGAYWLIWQLCMKVQGVQASDYKGISQAALSIQTLLDGVPGVFASLGRFFLEWDVTVFGWTVYGVLNVGFLILLTVGIGVSVTRSGLWKHGAKLTLFVVCCVLIPLAACVWQLISPDMDYNPMMLISLSVIYIFAMVIYEDWLVPVWKDLLGLVLAAVIFNCSLQANISYWFMQRTYEASCAMGTEMVTRIHLLEEQSRKLYVIGNIYDRIELKNAPMGDQIPLLGYALETNLLFDYDHTVLFLNNTFGTDFYCIRPEDRARLDEMEQVKNMPCWPAAGSVQMIGDVIVLKLAE